MHLKKKRRVLTPAARLVRYANDLNIPKMVLHKIVDRVIDVYLTDYNHLSHYEMPVIWYAQGHLGAAIIFINDLDGLTPFHDSRVAGLVVSAFDTATHISH